MNPVLLLLLVNLAFTSAFYKGTNVLTLTPKSFTSEVLNSNHVSVVEFYAPWCGHCKNLKPEYIKAANHLKGLVKVAAVNCDASANKPLCAKYDVKGFPTIKIFRPPKLTQAEIDGQLQAKSKKGGLAGSIRDPPAVEDYSGQRTAKAIIDSAITRIKNYVAPLTARSIDKFVDDISKTRVILLAARKSKSSANNVPALFKALAIDFLGPDSNFGFVSPSHSDLWSGFGLQVPDPESDAKSVLLVFPKGQDSPSFYSGDMKKEPIFKYLSEFLEYSEGKKTQNKKQNAKKDSKPDNEKAKNEKANNSSTRSGKLQPTEAAESAKSAKSKRERANNSVTAEQSESKSKSVEEEAKLEKDSKVNSQEDVRPEEAHGESINEIDESVKESAKDPLKEPVEESAEEPVEEPVKEPVEEPVEEPVQEPVEESIKESIEESIEEPIEEPIEESIEEPIEEPIKESVDESSEEHVKEPSEEPEEEAEERSVEESEEHAEDSEKLVEEQETGESVNTDPEPELEDRAQEDDVASPASENVSVPSEDSQDQAEKSTNAAQSVNSVVRRRPARTSETSENDSIDQKKGPASEQPYLEPTSLSKISSTKARPAEAGITSFKQVKEEVYLKRFRTFEEMKDYCLLPTSGPCVVVSMSANDQIPGFVALNELRSRLSEPHKSKIQYVYFIDIDDELEYLATELKFAPYRPHTTPKRMVGPPSWTHALAAAYIDRKDFSIINLSKRVDPANLYEFVSDILNGKSEDQKRKLPPRYSFHAKSGIRKHDEL